MFKTFAEAMAAARELANSTGWTARVYSEERGFEVLTPCETDAHLIEDTQVAVVEPDPIAEQLAAIDADVDRYPTIREALAAMAEVDRY